MNASRLAARAAATLSSLAVAMTGVSVLTTAPAQAAVRVSDYGFQTSAYGTRVQGASAGVQSARTAFAYISCTRLTGLNPSNTPSAHDDIAGIALPPGDVPTFAVDAVRSNSRTYRSKSGNVGTESTNSIAKVTIGPLVISGLRTTARAWADRSGRLHARSSAQGGVTLTTQTNTPLDAVLGNVSKPLGTLLDNIDLDGTTIPGVGTLYVGHTTNKTAKRYARSTATVLRVKLEAPADTTVTIGRSRARINKGLPAGVFTGAGWGADIPTALADAVHVGRLGTQPLPCQGTGGEVRVARTAGFDPGNAGVLELEALSGRSYGVQRRDGSANAWTRGRLGGLSLGPLHLEGVVGQANVRQSRSGRVRTSTAGSEVGAMWVDGQGEQAIPRPGRTICVGSGATCALRATFFVTHRTKRAVRVTAVRIEVLDLEGLPAGTIINLGNARTMIKRR